MFLLHFIVKFYGFSDSIEFLLVFKGVYTRTAGLVLIPFAAALDCGEVNRKRHMGQRFLKEPLLKQMLRSKASLPKYPVDLPCGSELSKLFLIVLAEKRVLVERWIPK